MNPPLPDHRRMTVKQPNYRSIGFLSAFQVLLPESENPEVG